MGTAGWLVTVYNIFKKFNINITGGEVEPETFQYGLMNIILTQHKFPDDIQCNSSLTHVNNNKLSLITTNPPFNSKKQIKFEKIKENFENDDYTKKNKIKIYDVFKLQKDDPPIQFLELDIFKLEDNGMCIIVLPYGEFFSGKSFANTRKYFLKTINITNIILVPKLFTHTDIKTCILIFEKNSIGTKEIQFSKINEECTNISHITSVKIKDIEKEPDFSWYHTDYLLDKIIYDLSLNMLDYEWVEFSKVFTMEKGKIQSSKVEECYDGEGVMVTQSKNFNDYKKIKNWTVNGENLFIGNIDSGHKFCIIFYNGKCDYTNLLSLCKINEQYKNKVNIKFIYYYFESLKEHLTDVYLKGSCNLSLDQKNFNRMKIPIPTIEEQQLIITDIMELEQGRQNILIAIDENKKWRLKYMENMIKNSNTRKLTTVMKLGDVCNFKNGKTLTSSNFIDGEYPVIGSGKKPIGYHNEYNMEENSIICATSGTAGLISKYKTKIWGSDCLQIKSINDNILNKLYLYNYLLLIQNSIFKYVKGCGQVHMDEKILSKFNIPIPTIEFQKYMEIPLNNFDKMDELLNKLLIDNKYYLGISFMNSLDDFGNPNTFNVHKLHIEDIKLTKIIKSKKQETSNTESETEEDIKPKKNIKSKKQETSNTESETEEDIKPTKIIKSKKQETSNTESETDEDIKPTKIFKSKNK